MHGVNLDLLHLGPHHPDGRSRDIHAHHRAAHLDDLRAGRRAKWQAVLARAMALLRKPASPHGKPQATCP